MDKLIVYFDYICPFCRRAYRWLTELAAAHPGVGIEFRPCEAHPRPESYGPHSDLCIQGFFFASECGADLFEYNSRMFSAAFSHKVDIENAAELAEVVAGLLDKDAFLDALRSGRFAARQLADNDLAYESDGVWALPAFRFGSLRLDAEEGVGVTKEQMADLFDSIDK